MSRWHFGTKDMSDCFLSRCVVTNSWVLRVGGEPGKTVGPILRGGAAWPHTPGGTDLCRSRDAPATPWSLGLVNDLRTWVGRSFETLLRHHTGHVSWCRGCVFGGTCYGLVGSLGTLRRYHAMGLCAGWSVDRNTLVGLLYCWDAPAIPCGGPGLGLVAKG